MEELNNIFDASVSLLPVFQNFSLFWLEREVTSLFWKARSVPGVIYEKLWKPVPICHMSDHNTPEHSLCVITNRENIMLLNRTYR